MLFNSFKLYKLSTNLSIFFTELILYYISLLIKTEIPEIKFKFLYFRESLDLLEYIIMVLNLSISKKDF